jgi:hypothetical protein
MVMQRIQRFLGGGNPKTSLSDFYGSLYPEDVRFALSHKQAQLGKAEIRSLIDRFSYEAVYLTTKGMASVPERQRKFLEGLTRIYRRADFHLDDLREFLRQQNERLPDDVQLGSAKLLQISRAGSEHWQRAFHDLAERAYAQNNRALPCLVAYASMLGYRHFVEVFSRESLGKIQILIPVWMLNPQDERMGYEISLGDEVEVQPQWKNDCLYGSWVCLHTECPMKHRFCSDAIFIDDTISSGETADSMKSFWHSAYGLQVPNERIHVITDLRQHSASIDEGTDNASNEGNSAI